MNNNQKTKKEDEIIENTYKDIEKSKILSQELLKQTKKSDDKYSQAFAQIHLGRYYLGKNDTKKSKDHLNQAEKIINQNNIENLKPKLYSAYALQQSMISNQQSAVDYYQKAYKYAQKYQDKIIEISVLNNLAHIFQNYKDIENAMKYCKKAYKTYIQAQIPYQGIKPFLINNLSQIYTQKGDYHCAASYGADLVAD